MATLKGPQGSMLGHAVGMCVYFMHLRGPFGLMIKSEGLLVYGNEPEPKPRSRFTYKF